MLRATAAIASLFFGCPEAENLPDDASPILKLSPQSHRLSDFRVIELIAQIDILSFGDGN